MKAEEKTEQGVKFCVDCKYFVKGGFFKEDLCAHPKLADLVTGEPKRRCFYERSLSFTQCGEAGKLFERRCGC